MGSVGPSFVVGLISVGALVGGAGPQPTWLPVWCATVAASHGIAGPLVSGTGSVHGLLGGLGVPGPVLSCWCWPGHKKG